jgi:hypothetical protein
MTIILTSLDNRLIDWCLMPTSALFQLYCGMNKCYINLDTLDNRHQKQNILVDVFKYNTVDVYEAVMILILVVGFLELKIRLSSDAYHRVLERKNMNNK